MSAKKAGGGTMRVLMRAVWMTVLAVAMGLGAQPALAVDTISVNFEKDVPVTSTAGVERVDNWNNVASGVYTMDNLTNSNGEATGVNIVLPTIGQWHSSSTDGEGGDVDMMHGYIDNFQNQTITITGLPQSFTDPGYDVYVYFNVDGQAQMGFTATDDLSNTDTRYGKQAGGAGENYPLGGENGYIVSRSTDNNYATCTEANAILLQGLTGANFTITGVSGVGAPGAGGRARPNGFQIVAVSTDPVIVLDPATVSENEPEGALVGEFAVENSTHTYIFSLVAGDGSTHNSQFDVENDDDLVTAEVLDREDGNGVHRSIRVLADNQTDPGNDLEAIFPITVGDVEEPMRLFANAEIEKQETGPIATFQTLNGDNESVTFDVDDTDFPDSAYFTIDGSGVLTKLEAAPDDTTKVYYVEVTATGDDDSSTDSMLVRIQVVAVTPEGTIFLFR